MTNSTPTTTPTTTTPPAAAEKRINWVSWLLLGAAVILAGTAAYIWFFQPAQLTITWTTENELDTIGYNVYRSDSADGEFLQINDVLIPAHTDAFLGGEHEFVDDGVQRGNTYFYKLETVGREGASEFEGPIELTAR